MKDCTCGHKFMDAEDCRDHLPCPGSEIEIARKQGAAGERARIVAWLCGFPTCGLVQSYADGIERGEHAS